MAFSLSNDRRDELKRQKKNREVIVSYLPVNPYSEAVVKKVAAEQGKLNSMEPSKRHKYILENKLFETAKNDGKVCYEITCKNCNEVQGYVFATNDSLNEWRDFFYRQWNDGNEWFGCITPHVSPIDGTLCLECACGSDTRDFRANSRILPRVVSKIEEVNSKGRKWGDTSSKYKAKAIKLNKLEEVLNGRSYL